MRRRVVIAAGGTAGHVYPALAIAAAFRVRFDADILFIGTPSGFETRLVPANGYRLEQVRAYPFLGVGRRAKLKSLLSVPWSAAEARRRLVDHGTRLVIGLGGYASAGPIFAARGLGITTAIHESNVIPGYSNLVLGRVADRIYLGSEAARGAFAASRARITGNPIRADIARDARSVRLQRADRKGAVRILVAGGSLGAPFLNDNVPALLRALAERRLSIEVRHQVGRYDVASVRARYAAARIPHAVESYFDDMAAAYAWADFAITRAGAATLAEIAAVGLPSLLVPLPAHARDHQGANAQAHARSGGAWCLSEPAWRESELAERLFELFSDRARLAELGQLAAKDAVLDAAEAIVEDLERIMRGRW